MWHLRQHRTAADRVGIGKDRHVNARFLAVASHYLSDAEFRNPASGWERGQVEKNVQDARHQLWQPMPVFSNRDALNSWLESRCVELWDKFLTGFCLTALPKSGTPSAPA